MIAAFPLLLAVIAAEPALDARPDEFDGAWSALVTEHRERCRVEGIVGASLSFMHRGQILGQDSFGHADLDSGRTVDERTIFHWASITKTFTGMAILQLRDRGELRLEDPIVQYLPELRRIHDPEGRVEQVTLRHLLSHSSGFRNPTWPWGTEDWHPHEPTSWEQLVSMLPYTRLHFAPGEKSSYSNLGIIFLGRVIELLSGDDYEVFVDKNLLRPLRMHETYFDGTPYHLLPQRSNNYSVRSGVPHANGLDFDTGITVSNGGLNAPVPDMLRYLAFLTGDSPEVDGAQDNGVEVLSRSSLKEMWRPVHSLPGADETPSQMALTFFVREHGGRRYICHTGGQKAFITCIEVHPESHTGAVIAFNTLGEGESRKPDTRALLEELRTSLYERIFARFEAE